MGNVCETDWDLLVLLAWIQMLMLFREEWSVLNRIKWLNSASVHHRQSNTTRDNEVGLGYLNCTASYKHSNLVSSELLS